MRIAEATSSGDIAACRALFEAYWASQAFAPCFQGFDRELAALPGDYAPPRGCLLLATTDDARPAGCVAVRPLPKAGAAEMKRLYVSEECRGTGLGRALAQAAIGRARELGYRELLLDTMPSMAGAQALYAALGFADVARYNDNTAAGVRFMRLDLAPVRP
jgi:ribosomal protein S18 acetylase RimI-like enzyme